MGDEKSWEVSIDFCHVFSQLCDSYFGKKTYVHFHPDKKYYAFVGQLMWMFSQKSVGGHGSFRVEYDDSPTLEMTETVFSLGDVYRLAGDMEEFLPAYRNFVTQTLPSLSVEVRNLDTLDTGEEIRA